MVLNSQIQQKLNELLTKDHYKGYELQLDKIAQKLSLSIFAATFTDPKLSGAIYKDKETGNFNLYVNAKHAITRKRFTIAHEIGHYISAICGSYSKEQLLNGENGFEDYAVSYRREGENDHSAETEANLIAAEMLMPKKWVRQFIEDGMGIEEMAKLLFVSEQAITIRVSSLGIDLL